MKTYSELNSKIEIISKGTLSQPALVRIEQQEYIAFDHDPNTILLLEEVAKGLLLKDIPLGISITPCKQVQYSDDPDIEVPLSPSRFEGIAPFRICNMGRGQAGIIFSWHCTKSFWSNDSGYRWKLQRARAAVLARRKSLGNIRFHRFIDEGYLAGVEFSQTIKMESVESMIRTSYQYSDLIHSIIEDSMRRNSEGVSNESVFVQETFIPLLKRLGFQNVIYYHGPREFGRDVLFSRQTEFGIPEYWAAQVKMGNVSGKANSYIDLIVSQAHDAFKIPLHDIQTKSKYWISKFVVAITGRFTENAVEKICEKIESHAMRNSILFLDGEKIQDLVESVGKRKFKVSSSLRFPAVQKKSLEV